MPETLYIDDRVEVLFDQNDFVDLIRQRMGDDAARYLLTAIDRLNDKANAMYEQGREDGYERGYADGELSYQEGYDAGYQDGMEQAHIERG